MAISEALQGWNSSLHVSADLGPPPGKPEASVGQQGFQAFFAENLETGVLVSTALVLTHPEQYALTRAALERLSGIDHAKHPRYNGGARRLHTDLVSSRDRERESSLASRTSSGVALSCLRSVSFPGDLTWSGVKVGV